MYSFKMETFTQKEWIEMEKFFILVIEFCIAAHQEMFQKKGYNPHQLNVFVDLVTKKLLLQYVCYIGGEQIIRETDERRDVFPLFSNAYELLASAMKSDGQKTEFYDVICKMQLQFLDYVDMYGYDRNIHFSIVHIPMED